MVVLGGMGNIWGVILGAVLLSFVPEMLRYTVEPMQRALFGRSLIDPEVIRMLLFGLAMVVMMLFRPAGPLALRGAQARARAARAGAMTEPAPILEAEGITKRFGGLHGALRGRACASSAGQIYGLIGPNGAGKTTLFNVLTGLYRQDAGRFRFEGKELRDITPDRIAAARHRAHLPEHPPLRQPLGAGERDDRPARAHRTRAWSARSCAAPRRAPRRRRSCSARASCSNTSASPRRGDELAKHLSYGDQRRLEIARALATDPRLLALDEPAAGMNATEKLELRKLLESIRRDGVTLLLIEHDVRLVMGLCDRVLVLDYGKQIAEGTAEDVQKRSRR